MLDVLEALSQGSVNSIKESDTNYVLQLNGPQSLLNIHHCPYRAKAAIVNRLGCVLMKFSLWSMKCEVHIIFTCHKILFLKIFFKTIQKQNSQSLLAHRPYKPRIWPWAYSSLTSVLSLWIMGAFLYDQIHGDYTVKQMR